MIVFALLLLSNNFVVLDFHPSHSHYTLVDHESENVGNVALKCLPGQLKIIDVSFFLKHFSQRIDDIGCRGRYFPVLHQGVFVGHIETNVFFLHVFDTFDGIVVYRHPIKVTSFGFLKLCETRIDLQTDLLQLLWSLVWGQISWKLSIKIGHKTTNLNLQRVSSLSHCVYFYEWNLLVLF